jgi:hypothetical protein
MAERKYEVLLTEGAEQDLESIYDLDEGHANKMTSGPLNE